MKPINWKKYKDKWKHLEDINFPTLGRRPIVDILIGMDYAELHFSIKNVKGNTGEPIACLTPLGWTCIGNNNCSYDCTQFGRSYFANKTEDYDQRADKLLRRFWEIENVEMKAKVMSKEDEKVLSTVKASKKWVDGRYQVKIPWKDNKVVLQNNYAYAVQRLASTERKLFRDETLSTTYSNIFGQYLEKGYIRKVNNVEGDPTMWYLPHFPVVREDKATTKVRIVFDAAAKTNGICLNDTIYQGPKLQRDLCTVLTRFRKYPVALVCDVAEMYLRIGLAPQDWFLWRNTIGFYGEI